MKKVWVLGCTITTALLLAQGTLKAEETTKGGHTYGIVDMQKVILSVDEGKQARSDLEKEIKEKEKGLGKQKEELDKLNQDWQKQAALLSEEARLSKQKDFQEKFMTLRKAEMDFQNEMKQKEQAATQKIAMKVAGLVDKIARDKKFVAVFETNSSGLLYLENPVDLTDQVIAVYNASEKELPKSAKK